MKSIKVYRLEDSEGHGPYHGDQPAVHFLTPHHDPINLITWMEYPKEILETLSKAGMVFGWRNQKLYREFFKRKGQKNCAEIGFHCTIYKTSTYFMFPDGQVMFLKDESIAEKLPAFSELLKIFSKKKTFVPRILRDKDFR